jgi:hypothetical protein
MQVDGRRLESQTLERSAYGEFLTPVALVANNRNQWDKLMLELAESGQLLVFPARSGEELAQLHGFDWSKTSLVLVTLGQVPTAGEDIEVTQVRHKGGLVLELYVAVRESGLAVQSMASPYHLLVIEHADWQGGEVVFVPEGGAAEPMAPRSVASDSSDPGILRITSLGTVKGAYR